MINHLSGIVNHFSGILHFPQKQGGDFVFYDRFSKLCGQAGVTPTQVARDLNMRQSTVSMWKKQGTTPKHDTIKKLSDYFGVTTDYLYGNVSEPSSELDYAQIAHEVDRDYRDRVNTALDQMNGLGVAKVADYAELLAGHPDYQRGKAAPESKDTTPEKGPSEGT